MTERARPTFDTQAVAKALGTQAQAVTDPAYGEGQHFQVRSNGTFLSLDTFPERGVSRITTKGARIELFGDMLPHVEDEGIVFMQKDQEHEHSTATIHPDGGLTFGYQVDAGPVAVDGLPQDMEDTEQIITRHEAVQAPAEEDSPPVTVQGAKPPEKPGPEPSRALGALPDVRPMIQQIESTPEPAKPTEGAPQQEQDAKEESEAGEAERQRVKLVGRLGRTPTVRETAGGKLVGKFPLAVHLDDGTTKWHNIVAFGERAAALKTRTEAGELVKGNEIEVVGYLHEREYQGRDGTTKTAQEIYSVAVTRH
ncbi:single-stranded DNA-binding protein [Streptomyces sp. NBC_00576]|uniref:single-stranded DNA-binding protein n=1 Tax=Streptomyces sp. NBC_00576 TaxID=2903665 RepID=UPI002E809B84|nr:single-stranded DNA-binding protein [Streptomyces sp. NBC_00576]WUB69567.1 single-stranded DNA-binding protein [Streptomyces sp. NBC_00576]